MRQLRDAEADLTSQVQHRLAEAATEFRDLAMETMMDLGAGVFTAGAVQAAVEWAMDECESIEGREYWLHPEPDMKQAILRVCMRAVNGRLNAGLRREDG